MLMVSGRKIARNVMSMASTTTTDATAQVETSSVTSDPPELVKTIQQAVRNLIKFIFIFNLLIWLDYT